MKDILVDVLLVPAGIGRVVLLGVGNVNHGDREWCAVAHHLHRRHLKDMRSPFPGSLHKCSCSWVWEWAGEDVLVDAVN